MATTNILPRESWQPSLRPEIHAVPEPSSNLQIDGEAAEVRHLREAHRRAHQAPAPQEVDGPGRTRPPHRPLRQLPLAARNRPRRAHAAQSRPHRHGLLQRPQLLLRARAAHPVPHPSRQGSRAPAAVRRRRSLPTSSSRSATWCPTASSIPTSPSSFPPSQARSRARTSTSAASSSSSSPETSPSATASTPTTWSRATPSTSTPPPRTATSVLATAMATALIVTLQQPIAIPGNGPRANQSVSLGNRPMRSASASAPRIARAAVVPKAG
jgi:hypothetical protein